MSHNSTIKPKTGKCCEILCDYEGQIVAGRCPYHYQKYRATVCAERAERKGKSAHIKEKELKELERQLQYAKESKAWLKLPEHQLCEAKLKGCTIKATQVHHGRGRMLTKKVDYLLAKEFWKAICHNCHNGPDGVTENSKQAIEMGLSFKRNT